MPTACGPPAYSQTEAYAVVLAANPNPSKSGFLADAALTCSGCVQFQNRLLSAPKT